MSRRSRIEGVRVGGAMNSVGRANGDRRVHAIRRVHGHGDALKSATLTRTSPCDAGAADRYDTGDESKAYDPYPHDVEPLSELLAPPELASGTRVEAHSVTSLASVWPEVSRRLHGYLLQRGAPRESAADVVQETGLRAFERGVTFVDADDLLRWCVTVARNLDIDRRRDEARQTSFETNPRVADRLPLEELVSVRLELAAALKAMTSLSERDRQMILDGINAQGSADGKSRVARHRARQRLARLIALPAGVLVVLMRGCRRLAGTGRDPLVWSTSAFVIGTAALVVAPILGPGLQRTPAIPTPRAAVLVEPHTQQVVSGRRTVQRIRVRSTPNTRRGHQRGETQPIFETPDPNHTVAVTSHPRGTADAGVVCIDDFPVVGHGCLGPQHLPPTAQAVSAGRPRVAGG